MLDLLIRALSHILVPLFLLGLAGSAIVVVITLIHDVHEFFTDSGDTSTHTDSLT